MSGHLERQHHDLHDVVEQLTRVVGQLTEKVAQLTRRVKDLEAEYTSDDSSAGPPSLASGHGSHPVAGRQCVYCAHLQPRQPHLWREDASSSDSDGDQFSAGASPEGAAPAAPVAKPPPPGLPDTVMPAAKSPPPKHFRGCKDISSLNAPAAKAPPPMFFYSFVTEADDAAENRHARAAVAAANRRILAPMLENVCAAHASARAAKAKAPPPPLLSIMDAGYEHDIAHWYARRASDAIWSDALLPLHDIANWYGPASDSERASGTIASDSE